MGLGKNRKYCGTVSRHFTASSSCQTRYCCLLGSLGLRRKHGLKVHGKITQTLFTLVNNSGPEWCHSKVGLTWAILFLYFTFAYFQFWTGKKKQTKKFKKYIKRFGQETSFTLEQYWLPNYFVELYLWDKQFNFIVV